MTREPSPASKIPLRARSNRHRPELEQDEVLSAPPDPGLPEQDRPRGTQPHCKRDKSHERQEEKQSEKDSRYVEDTLQHLTTLAPA